MDYDYTNQIIKSASKIADVRNNIADLNIDWFVNVGEYEDNDENFNLILLALPVYWQPTGAATQYLIKPPLNGANTPGKGE